MIPNSEIWLCKNTKLRIGGEDTYNFASESARFNFFVGKSGSGLHFTNLSYQRDNKAVRLPISFAAASECDYMVFTNTGYSAKHWYAFITDVRYINDELTELEFKIDPMQTWFPALTLGSSLVSRETPATDTIFANIQPEPDMGGELFTYRQGALGAAYDSNHKWADGATVQSGYIVVAAKKGLVQVPAAHATNWYSDVIELQKTEDQPTYAGTTVHMTTFVPPIDNSRGVGCSYVYYCFPNDSDGFRACGLLLNDYAVFKQTTAEDIAAVFMCPACALPDAMVAAFAGGTVSTSDCFLVVGETVYNALNGQIVTGSSSYNNLHLYQLPTSVTQDTATLSVQNDATNNIFGGYVPKNKKLWNAPYSQITLDNGTGEQLTFSPERFANTSNTVYFYPQLDMTAQVTAAVSGYNGDDKLFHCLQLDSYPTFNWQSNSFSEWSALFGNYQAEKCALNDVSSAISGASGIVGGALSVMSGNVGGYVSAAGSAANMGLDIKRNHLEYNQSLAVARNAAPKSHGTTRGNLTRTQLGQDYIVVLYRSLKAQDAEKVDNFFTKYGYATNCFKSIDITARPRFYYVKTDDFNVSAGSIPTTALQEIANIFQAGIRFWHGDYLGDYSVSNAV